jgi:hypothetical protein
VEGMSFTARIAIVIGLVYCCAAAQSNEWPLFLNVPGGPDSAIDSSRLHVTTEQTAFENSAKTSNTLAWKKETSAWRIQQNVLYNAIQDNNAHALNQNFDLPGSFERKHLLPGGGDIGLEWKPISYLSLLKSGGDFQVNSDMGPFMQWRPYKVPLVIHGGISASTWSDSLRAPLGDSKMKDVYGDAGSYGGVSMGDFSKRFLGLPLYLNAEVFGRSIKNLGLGVVRGSALYVHEMGDGDSVFAFYGDSLSDGKERSWGSNNGQQNFFNTPWRIAHSLQATGAFKGKERFSLKPSVIYTYAQNSVSYPTEQHLSDVKTTASTIHLLLSNNEEGRLHYKGGLKLTWGNETWLFGTDLRAAASLGYHYNSLQLDSLNTKLSDHTTYTASSDHEVLLQILPWLRAQYTLSALRNSFTYTFSYKENDSSVRKGNDQDLITINHHLGLTAEQFHAFNIEMYGELSEYVVNYLKSQQSSKNNTQNGYRLGFRLAYLPSERFHIDEHLIANAQITDYLYKESHLDPLTRPPYSREFLSLCSGAWKIGGPWELAGRWTETYDDNGMWYGSQYLPDTAPGAVRSDYYAVTRKSLNYSIQLSVAVGSGRKRLETGCVLREDYSKRFVGSTYASIYNGYNIEPFSELKLGFKHFGLNARAARLINTYAIDRWAIGKNWDVHIMGQGTW